MSTKVEVGGLLNSRIIVSPPKLGKPIFLRLGAVVGEQDWWLYGNGQILDFGGPWLLNYETREKVLLPDGVDLDKKRGLVVDEGKIRRLKILMEIFRNNQGLQKKLLKKLFILYL